jgi:hypothetical protein
MLSITYTPYGSLPTWTIKPQQSSSGQWLVFLFSMVGSGSGKNKDGTNFISPLTNAFPLSVVLITTLVTRASTPCGAPSLITFGGHPLNRMSSGTSIHIISASSAKQPRSASHPPLPSLHLYSAEHTLIPCSCHVPWGSDTLFKLAAPSPLGLNGMLSTLRPAAT